MSDIDYGQDQANDDDLVRRLRAEIRKRDERIEEVTWENSELAKATVFTKLGLDTSKGVGKLFFQAYEGDLTEDAIKAAGAEYDITFGEDAAATAATTTQETTTPATPPANADAAAHAAMNQASAGASANGEGQTLDDKAWSSYHETMSKTGNAEAAMANHFQTKFLAAAEQMAQR